MQTKGNFLLFLIFSVVGGVVFLGLPAHGYGNQDNTIEPSCITRDRMIEIAEAYANHEWYPSEENIVPRTVQYDSLFDWIEERMKQNPLVQLFCVLFGVKRVDTPDRDTHSDWPDSIGWKAGETNIGVPYQWGGFSSISGFDLVNPKDFDEQYTGTGKFYGKVHYAGDIFTGSEIRSRNACGVDCSGFVSRCWNLPFHMTTEWLETNMFSLPTTIYELEKGDILNRPHGHVMLFKEFLNPEKTVISVYEATYTDWRVSEQTYEIVEVSSDGHSVTLDESGTYGLYTYRWKSHNLTIE